MIIPNNAKPGVVLDAAARDQRRPQLLHTALPSTHLMRLNCAAYAFVHASCVCLLTVSTPSSLALILLSSWQPSRC